LKKLNYLSQSNNTQGNNNIIMTDDNASTPNEIKETTKTPEDKKLSDTRQTSRSEDDLPVKPEFVLTTLHPTLTQPSKEEKSSETNNRDSSKPKQKENRHKRNKKELKKRTRENDNELKLCKATLTGTECAYGDKCKFSHDIKEVLNTREKDIIEVGTCPIYESKGSCPYGISCRVGSCHLNMATGQNISKSEAEIEKLAKENKTEIMNVLPRSVSDKLRKKKYKFVCKRHFEKENQQEKKKSPEKVEEKLDKEAETVENAKESKPKEPIDMTPLPKMRKLIDFSNKVYVAPLTTVGNLPFRRVMKKFGADITCGEMAVAKNLLEGKSGEWALMKRHPDEDIFGVQIAAGHADMYTRLTEIIKNEDLDVDFVDMNLGCPIDVLCDNGCGAMLMLRENKLRDSIKGMMGVLDCPITVKIRTGWDEKKPFAHKLVPKIQAWGLGGVAAVMIHGRSRLQRYSKLANWDYIQEVAAAQSSEVPQIPIIGNGDILSYKDYEEKVLKHEGLSSTAMLGRGALIKPWLPTEIKEKRDWDISASERLDLLKDFVKFGLEHWGSDQRGVNTTRRFLLEWLSFLHRYIPVGMLEVVPQSMNQRPPNYLCGRSDLETLMLSKNSKDWVKISEMLLGQAPDGFVFEPKHKAKSY